MYKQRINLGKLITITTFHPLTTTPSHYVLATHSRFILSLHPPTLSTCVFLYIGILIIIKLGGWIEEVWQSYFSIGKCYMRMGEEAQVSKLH